MPGPVERLLVVGLGLIGGSLVHAVRAASACSWVGAWESDAATRRQARASGLLDGVFQELQELPGSVDLVVLALPPAALEESLCALRDHFGAELPVLTDTTSFKLGVVQLARSVFGRLPPQLVLGHPLSGSEKSGFQAASAALLPGCRVILSPTDATHPQACAQVRAFWQGLGCELLEVSPEEHDRLLGSFSHMPHLLAYALMDLLGQRHPQEDAFVFSGPGLRDMTRLAGGNPVLWRDIVLANRAPVLEALEEYQACLEKLRQDLAGEDGEKLLASLKRSAAVRARLEQQAPARAPNSRPHEK